MEYNISYRERSGAAPQPAAVVPAPRTPGEPLFASVRGAVYQISEDECVLKVADSEERHVMTLQVFQALSLCQQFANGKQTHHDQNWRYARQQLRAVECKAVDS